MGLKYSAMYLPYGNVVGSFRLWYVAVRANLGRHDLSGRISSKNWHYWRNCNDMHHASFKSIMVFCIYFCETSIKLYVILIDIL